MTALAPPPLPIIEVSHLPSAFSFYATCTQSLGLFYLSNSPARLHFGYISDLGPQIVFSLQQSPVVPCRPSHITLLAQSPASVKEFYRQSLLANARQRDPSIKEDGEETKARARDLDGNMLEAIYTPRRPTISTASTPKEARRVLEWQEDVARSVAEVPDPVPSPAESGGAPFRQAESYTVSQPPLRLVRRDTVTTETYRRPGSSDERPGGGFSGMKLVGTLLGAAAGAAVAYAMVSSTDSSSRDSTFTAPVAPVAPVAPAAPTRRASYDMYESPVVERRPARSYLARAEEGAGYVAQYTIAAAPPPMARIQEVADVDDPITMEERDRSRTPEREGDRDEVTVIEESPKSHVSHRSHRSHKSHRSHRSHVSRRDGEERSHVSRREGEERSHVSRRDAGDEREDKKSYHGSRKTESYVSARSHHTNRTSGSRYQQEPQKVRYVVAESPRSRASSSGSEHTVRRSKKSDRGSRVDRDYVDEPERERRSVISARNVPLPMSVVSARNVPLPQSEVGGYAASVAPSDSVSSVGSKMERLRLKDRMRERW
ncbi:hypothetical protein B0O99DRAFT_688239 [Bisporella sp. PMI_857]|nr:hypothetical protein B0O99DRAFT_688239 [Bisporella sp. PMI_857]